MESDVTSTLSAKSTTKERDEANNKNNENLKKFNLVPFKN